MNYLACYKGPSEGFRNIVFHKVTCWWTGSIYSHCEIVMGDDSFSSSSRDGGVRKKQIDYSSAKWDLYPIELDELHVLKLFERTDKDKYDYVGLFWFVFGYLRQKDDRWFCSEWSAMAMKLPFAHKLHIQDLVDYIKGKYDYSK